MSCVVSFFYFALNCLTNVFLMPQFGVNVIVIVLSFIPYNRNGAALLMSGCEAVDRLRRMGSTEQHHFLYLHETSRKENITTW